MIVLILKNVVWATNHKAASAPFWFPVGFSFLLDSAIWIYCLSLKPSLCSFLMYRMMFSTCIDLLKCLFALGEVSLKTRSSFKYSLLQFYLAENLLGFSGSFERSNGSGMKGHLPFRYSFFLPVSSLFGSNLVGRLISIILWYPHKLQKEIKR